MKAGPSPPHPAHRRGLGPVGQLPPGLLPPHGIRTKDLGRSSAQPADSSQHPALEPQAGWAWPGAGISACITVPRGSSPTPTISTKCSGGPLHVSGSRRLIFPPKPLLSPSFLPLHLSVGYLSVNARRSFPTLTSPALTDPVSGPQPPPLPGMPLCTPSTPPITLNDQGCLPGSPAPTEESGVAGLAGSWHREASPDDLAEP